MLLRGYYECLKTISPKLRGKSHTFGTNKILPIFIDLSNCNELFSDDTNIEVHFIRQIIESLKRQLEVMYDEKSLLIFKKENPALDDLEFIEKILIEGVTISRERKVAIEDSLKRSENGSIKGTLSLQPSISTDISQSDEKVQSQKYTEIKGLNVQDFINKISDIKRKANIDRIYVFIDEFSDLTDEAQINFSKLLKNLLASKINMFFKIGVITDRYSFGDKIILGRDLYPIPLDLNEHVEKYNGTIYAIKKMEVFIEQLLEKRFDIFCPDVSFNDVFKIKKEVVMNRLARASMGVTRTIGWVLQNAWKQCQDNNTPTDRIGLQELSFGIRSARKIYFKQFQGSVKKRLIPAFYMDLWDAIINKAISEKTKSPDRPASHFLIDPIRKDYLNILSENFLVHFLEEGRASKAGGNYNLYAIDYDICLDNNIKYAEEKDEFTAVRFIYDVELSKFDPYFIKDKIKSYRCNACGTIYDEQSVSQFKVKRCFEDDTKLEEIIHKEMPRTEGNYVEVEIKILGLISSLELHEAMSAQEIADAVGCSRQKVSSWGSFVLAKKNLINIVSKQGKNYYYESEN
ncbi:hypothetical protein [Paenibacillus sp. PAMC 26794]|uniref:hypothetical protein n=1 Tax=Paenibacillus sp. PAMC 26794 TaxID=1257080 RepID=UPI000308C759|nr:hypothetical protein [Paenibacillus sp. PAMC 26794]